VIEDHGSELYFRLVKHGDISRARASLHSDLESLTATILYRRQEQADVSIQVIARALPKGLKNLQLIGFNSDVGATALAQHLPPGLSTLKLVAGNISDVGAIALAASLSSFNALKELQITGNQIGDDGVRVLVQALPSSLLSLDFSQNIFSSAGVESLAESLSRFSDLKILRLGANHLTNVGVTALAASVPHCRVLEELDLRGTSFDDEGAEAMNVALPRCASLKHLDMSANWITDQGARSFAEVLPRCPALKVVKLNYCRFTNVGAQALADCWPQCRHNIDLDLEASNIAPELWRPGTGIRLMLNRQYVQLWNCGRAAG